jgi:hypothetical protein
MTKTISFKDKVPLTSLNNVPTIKSTDKPVWITVPFMTFNSATTEDFQHIKSEGRLPKGGTSYDVYVLEQVKTKYETYTNDRTDRVDRRLVKDINFALVLELKLSYYVKHLYAFPIAGRIGQGYDFRAEAQFTKYYSIKTVNEDEVSALEALHPNTMTSILDNLPDASLEYYKDKIRITVPIGYTQVLDDVTLALTNEEFINKIDKILEVANDIVRGSRTIKIDANDETYQEINFKKEFAFLGKIAKIGLGSIALLIAAIVGLNILF